MNKSTLEAPAAVSQKIPWAQPDFWGGEEKYLLEALHSTWISGGPFVERLEKEVAALTGSRFALAASNGTTAIHMAYLGIGLEPGDEVIVPGFCFLAAANVAMHLGAKPVFADVDPDTWCVTAEAIERVMTPKTKVIVPVHTYGNVCDMDPILELASSRGVVVMEDAAESFASKYKGKWSGAIAPIGTFSFQATKTITTGEGGMVVTNDPALQRRMALYRSHGMLGKRYLHEVPGHNFRLTNLQASLGCAQLERLGTIETERRRVHATYTEQLRGNDGVRPQVYPPNVDPVLWAIAVEIDAKAYPQGRDAVIDQLAELGIETRNGFYASTMLDIYEDRRPLPVCERLSRNVISLPTYPTLDDERIAAICAALASLRR
jgi:perosamine synthetase